MGDAAPYISGVISPYLKWFWAHRVEFHDSHKKSWYLLVIPSFQTKTSHPMPAQNGWTPTSVCKTAPFDPREKSVGWLVFCVFFFLGKMSWRHVRKSQSFITQNRQMFFCEKNKQKHAGEIDVNG